MKKFSIGEAISFGWKVVKSNFLFFVGLQLAVFLIEASFRLSSVFFPEDQKIIVIIIRFIGAIISMGLTLGMMHIALTFVDGKKSNFSDLFSQFKARLLLQYFGTSIAYGIGSVLGLILFIIPGVFVIIRLMFYGYVLVDKGGNGLDALKISWSMTKGNMIQIIGFGLTICLVNIVGVLILIVGLLVTLPLSAVAAAYVYRKLSA